MLLGFWYDRLLAGKFKDSYRLNGLQRIREGMEQDDHGVEIRSFPNSLATTLAALPSISLIPSARLHG